MFKMFKIMMQKSWMLDSFDKDAGKYMNGDPIIDL